MTKKKQTEAQVKFSANTQEFTAGIVEANKSIKLMQNQLKLNSVQLKGNAGDVTLLSERQQILQNELAESQKKVQLTNQKLEEARKLLGENSKEYNDLSNSILRAKTQQAQIQNELNQTTQDLKEAEKNANNLGEEFEGMGESVDSASNDMGGLSGVLAKLKGATSSGATGVIALGTALGQLASNAISGAIRKLKEFIGYLWELPESTREFRTNMNKVNAAASQYNVSTKNAMEQTKLFYSYLGDDMAAANCTTNLLGLKLSQEDLMKASNAAISVWTAYGDSIPIEGLTESINETAQVSKVTGSLADALNWAGISEDNFNKKLEQTKSTQERAKLITDTLNQAYGNSKQKYDEMSEGAIAYNSSVFSLQESQSKLAEVIEPIQSRFNILKATLLEKLAPAIEKLLDGLDKVIDWFNNLQAPVKNAILIFGAVVAVLTTVAVVVGVLTAVVTMLNISLLPVIAIILGITAAVTAIIIVIQNWGNITQWLLDKWNTFTSWIVRNFKNMAQAVIMSVNELKEGAINKFNELKEKIKSVLELVKSTVTSIFENIKSRILEKVEQIKSKVRDGFEKVKSNIINPIKTAYSNVKSFFTQIYDTIKGKMEQAMNKVRSCVDKIKGFFNFKFTWPKLPLPHFSITPPGWKVGDLLKGSIPKLGVQFYAKGGIMTQPTAFGMNGNNVMVGGERGAEAVLPLDGFYNYLDNKLDSISQQESFNYEAMGNAMAIAMTKVGIYMDGTTVGRITSETVEKETTIRNNIRNRMRGEFD